MFLFDMPRWTKDDLNAYTARRSGKTAEIARATSEMLATDPKAKVGILGANGLNVIERVTPKKKPMLNKLEAAFYEVLKQRHPHGHVLPMGVKLRLGENCHYTPDFFVATYPMEGNGMELACYETKGPHAWDDSIVKLKTAAKIFLFIKFTLVKRQAGQWIEKEIGSL